MLNTYMKKKLPKIKKTWKKLKYNWNPDFEKDFWIMNNDLYYKDTENKTGLEKTSSGWTLIVEGFDDKITLEEKIQKRTRKNGKKLKKLL